MRKTTQRQQPLLLRSSFFSSSRWSDWVLSCPMAALGRTAVLSIVAGSTPPSALSLELSQELAFNKQTMGQKAAESTNRNLSTAFVQWTPSPLCVTLLRPTLHTTSMNLSTLSPTVMASSATSQQVPSTSFPFHPHTRPIMMGTPNLSDVAPPLIRIQRITPPRYHSPHESLRQLYKTYRLCSV